MPSKLERPLSAVMIIALEAVNHNHGRRLWMAEVMLMIQKIAAEKYEMSFSYLLHEHILRM